MANVEGEATGLIVVFHVGVKQSLPSLAYFVSLRKSGGSSFKHTEYYSSLGLESQSNRYFPLFSDDLTFSEDE
jgi:hypothetical protein